MNKKILFLEDDKKIIESILNTILLKECELVVLNEMDEIKEILTNGKNIILILLSDTYKNLLSEILSFKSRLSIIVIGNEINSEEICKFFDLGVEDYISKTININIIIARIKAVLKRL